MGQHQAWFVSYPISPVHVLLGKEKQRSCNARTWALPPHGQGAAAHQPRWLCLLKAVKGKGQRAEKQFPVPAAGIKKE